MQLSDFVGLQIYTPDTIPRWERIDRDLVKKLDQLTVALGRSVPLQLLSLFRTPEENVAAGGTDGSMHLVGKAADFVIPGNVLDVYDLAQKTGFTGIGLYVNPANAWSMHVDVRPGGPARWSRVDGVYGAIGQAFERAKYLLTETPAGRVGSALFLGLTALVLYAIFRRT